MNIMLVTVTERTREIGIRKAIGAPKSAILVQFLDRGGPDIADRRRSRASPSGSSARSSGSTACSRWSRGYSILLALGVTVVVGIFFGFYPANRAASLRPIDALRYE